MKVSEMKPNVSYRLDTDEELRSDIERLRCKNIVHSIFILLNELSVEGNKNAFEYIKDLYIEEQSK